MRFYGEERRELIFPPQFKKEDRFFGLIFCLISINVFNLFRYQSYPKT